MKKFIVLSILGVMVVILSSAIEKVQKSAGPPSCHAGEPPNNTTCLECHNDGTLNSGSAKVFFDLGGADTNYVPGKIYTITISISKPGMRRAGFQCIALRDDDDKTSPGKVTLTDAVRTQILDKNAPHAGGCLNEERAWIEHTYAGNSCNDTGLSKWSYQWQAPETPTGNITFYLALLEANNDLAETGDEVYTVKKTIAGLPVGLKDVVVANSFTVYPIPANAEIYVKTGAYVPEEIILYDLTSQTIKSWDVKYVKSDQGALLLPTSGLKPGIYLLNLKGRFGSVVKKIIIQ